MDTKEPVGKKSGNAILEKDRETRPLAAGGHRRRPWWSCSSARRPGSSICRSMTRSPSWTASCRAWKKTGHRQDQCGRTGKVPGQNAGGRSPVQDRHARTARKGGNPSLLTNVSKSGQEVGLEFLLFEPKAETKQEFYAEIPVAMNIRGDYHNLAVFFDKVARLSRIVNINNITINRGKDIKDQRSQHVLHGGHLQVRGAAAATAPPKPAPAAKPAAKPNAGKDDAKPKSNPKNMNL
ncbi:MAG: type 4a pilus biogenesis protein PilO [Desulfobacterales bacterium]|nr:type 4a pilus biogenesis protein PilO [Desulfobacterales bacterium]